MRSPRRQLETACRIGAFGILGWLLGTSIIPPSSRRVTHDAVENLPARLPSLARTAGSAALHVTVSATPDMWVTDWLAALRHSGQVVTWSGRPTPVAIAAERTADPAGTVRVDVAGPPGASAFLSDNAGVVDTLHVQRLGAGVEARGLIGDLRVAVGKESAAAAVPDTSGGRAVVVIGMAGWEGKYVVSALEERGWPVMARFTVAPSVAVTQGIDQSLDTARVAAVVALDSSIASHAASIERFVRAGGGLVLAGSAANALPRLAAGVPERRTRASGSPNDTVSLGSTGFQPVKAVREDAIVLERRQEGIVVAARRAGSGRVVQLGYDDTWRWRMAGGPGSEEAHRAWWTRVVSSVAYVPGGSAQSTASGSAPVASLVDRLGAARPVPDVPTKPVDRRILITLMMILLLTEWASRRLRGLR